MLGFNLHSRIHGVGVIRSAGGDIEPALKDIIALDAFQHFDENSGTTHLTNKDIHDSLRACVPAKRHHEINDMMFGAIDKLESVIDDVAILRENLYAREQFAENTFESTYDLKSGKLEAVTIT
ncbi:hypothetical protein BELL_0122g00110 [Botrytis elliptica]|uniref:Uncharacterized protein n=1 Tax=Botrytis elliptica TaxID=278938 RepID=A0A4Z1JTY6_9HELO|nr:hypothetical protein BELL_0122g00110 [Botrytis elliptica]